LQQPATRYSTLQHTAADRENALYFIEAQTQISLQHTATHCNTLQHTAAHLEHALDFIEAQTQIIL